MNDKLKNLIVRTLSGAVMLALLLAATLYSFWSFAALMLLVVVGAMWEFYRLADADGAAPLRWMGILFGVAVFATGVVIAGVWGDLSIVLVEALTPMIFLVPVMPALILIAGLLCGQENPLRSAAATLMGPLYVALPMALLLFIPMLLTRTWSPWSVLCFIFIIWANDVFAYLVGITLGRHKMCPSISPKKSWEGFFGGLVGAVLFGYAAARLLDSDPLMWCGMALVAAVAGVAGDLIESQFKRKAGVKDSGTLIPGHGGLLDRFDALLLATPLACVYLVIYLVILK